MTPEEETAWREKERIRIRERMARLRKERPEYLKAIYKKCYDKNPQPFKDRAKKWQTPERQKQRNQRRKPQMAEYRIRIADRIKDMNQKRIAEISDAYVASKLRIPVAMLREYLPNLLESKRQEILLKRQLNPKQNQ